MVATCVDATGMDATGMDTTGMDATGMDATGMDATGVDPTGVGRPPHGQGLLLITEQRRHVHRWSCGVLTSATHDCAAALAVAELAIAGSLPIQASTRSPQGMHLRCLVQEELLHLRLLLWVAARRRAAAAAISAAALALGVLQHLLLHRLTFCSCRAA